MKKILFFLILVAVIPAFAFADFQIGAIAMVKGTAASIQTGGIKANDFTYGGEARLNLGILQGGVSALYYPADADMPASIVALTDVGLALDIWFIRLGAGLGPNFYSQLQNSGGTRPLSVGLNMKLAGDINLGSISVGVVAYYYLNSLSDLRTAGKARPWVGLTAMLKLF